MLQGLCQLHAAVVVSGLGSLTEPSFPVERAHTNTLYTHTADKLMLFGAAEWGGKVIVELQVCSVSHTDADDLLGSI